VTGRRAPRLAGFVAALALASALCAAAARADDDETTLVATARWQMQGGKLSVVAPLVEALTPKQKTMIEGGFTTVSQLSLKLPPPGVDPSDARAGSDDRQPFASVRCTVKFDAWEETYDVARLDEQPRTALVKKLADYGDLCLKADVGETDVLGRLMEKGGTILAHLIVKQTSVEEAGRIKDWLIQQQSGVMQSLFSHMLGELSFNQTLIVRVDVPPKPMTVEEHPAERSETTDQPGQPPAQPKPGKKG
jgi:hypothetical protein